MYLKRPDKTEDLPLKSQILGVSQNVGIFSVPVKFHENITRIPEFRLDC